MNEQQQLETAEQIAGLINFLNRNGSSSVYISFKNGDGQGQMPNDRELTHIVEVGQPGGAAVGLEQTVGVMADPVVGAILQADSEDNRAIHLTIERKRFGGIKAKVYHSSPAGAGGILRGEFQTNGVVRDPDTSEVTWKISATDTTGNRYTETDEVRSFAFLLSSALGAQSTPPQREATLERHTDWNLGSQGIWSVEFEDAFRDIIYSSDAYAVTYSPALNQPHGAGGVQGRHRLSGD